VEAGETVTCTFTNTKQGKVIVKKVMVGGSDSFAFSGTPSGSIDTSGGTISADVAPGQYTSTEAAKAGWVNIPAGWDLTGTSCSDGSPVNSISLQAGETVTCTFTNTKKGNIVVEKKTNPSGDPQKFTFDPSWGADFELSDGQSNDSGPLTPGTYSVTETVPAGWDLESATCDDGSSPSSIALGPGETVTCTFTNEKDAFIVVEKKTNPSGDPQKFTFNPSWGASFQLSDGQSASSGDLDPGTYSVSETVPQGWDLESATCSDGSSPASIALAAGETVTCTFTNEKDANVVVQKQTNPDGDPQAFQFSASYDADGFSLADNQQNDSGDLDPGTYSVSETVPTGWDLTSAVCSDGSQPSAIALAAGETVTCVFTNTKRGTIIVEKQTAPDKAAGSFTFTGDAAGSIGDGGQIVVANLVPGTYTSTETVPAGWGLTSISCSDANSTGSLPTRTATFRLEAGETVKCTFTNTKLGQGSISVSKSAEPTTLKEPGGNVTYTVTITNTSTLNVTIQNVVDDKFGDLDDEGGSGCFDVPINMAPGQSTYCQFTRAITGTGGTQHVNTVTATGKDEAGNPVSASDDAAVTITPRLIDLVIVKEATSPTPLNGIVTYDMTVTNKGPDTATNVQLGDPAPAGITYLTATPSQGTCSVSPALVTCNLGTIAPGQTVTIRVTGRATLVGTHVNTATVSGQGGRETNPADNVDSAQTIVPQPAKPPTPTPKPPAPVLCLDLTVTPKTITADGKPDKVRVLVTSGKKREKGIRVVVAGAGVKKAASTGKNGVAVLTINPRKAGLITVTAAERNRKICGPQRIGVVGVFLPPVTG
jgi:uncharacterized repeat protein (TIGR01451 family)